MAAAAVEAKEALNNDATDECECCGKQFLREGNFLRHKERWCRNRNQRQQQSRKERDVRLRLEACDTVLLRSHTERKAALGTETVTLNAPPEEHMPIGIELEEEPAGCFVVSGVSGLAGASARIAEGFFAINFQRDGSVQTPVSGVGDFSGTLAPGQSLTITFQYPPAPIPYHGSARYRAHKRVKFKLHPEQKRWLEEHAFPHRRRMRPPEVHRLMKLTFRHMMRTDTMTPMWLEMNQIARWLSDKTKEETQQRREQKNRTAETHEKEKSSSSRSSKKRRAPATKKMETEKQKNMPTDDGSSSSMEEDESDAEDEMSVGDD